MSRAARLSAQLRLVFTSDGVRSQSRSCKSACDLVKIKNQNRTRSHKRDEIRSFPFFFRPRLRLPSPTFRLCFSENQIVGVGSRSGRLKQSQCTFPRFVIGLVLPLLDPTPTICFSLDHKRIVSDGVVSGIRTMFSLHHKLYACDYNSDSVVASENQPLSLVSDKA